MRAKDFKFSIIQFQTTANSFRRTVNEPQHNDRLAAQASWMKLCSCMDALNDTCEGLLAYEKTVREARKDGVTETGRSEFYLVIYGVLQLIYVQQDALLTLAKIFSIGFSVKDFEKKYPAMRRARTLRDISIGHPTSINIHGEKLRACSFIARHTLTPDTFGILVAKLGSNTFENFYVPEVISGHLREARKVLIQIRAAV